MSSSNRNIKQMRVGSELHQRIIEAAERERRSVRVVTEDALEIELRVREERERQQSGAEA